MFSDCFIGRDHVIVCQCSSHILYENKDEVTNRVSDSKMQCVNHVQGSNLSSSIHSRLCDREWPCKIWEELLTQNLGLFLVKIQGVGWLKNPFFRKVNLPKWICIPFSPGWLILNVIVNLRMLNKPIISLQTFQQKKSGSDDCFFCQSVTSVQMSLQCTRGIP